MKNAASLLIFLCVTTAFAADILKTAVIKETDSALSIDVHEHQFLRIHNFTQDGGSTRGVVIAAAATPTATASSTSTPAPTATPSAPDLTATKRDNVNGHATMNSWTWTITVANRGGTSCSFASGQTILSDNLPNGNIAYSSPSPSSATINPADVSCTINNTSDDLTCTAAAPGVTFGPGDSFDVSFSAMTTTAGTYANPRAGGNCSVDPGSAVPESNETNNTCADTVTSGTPTPTPTPTAPPRAVLTASLVDPASSPEPIKQVVIDGPAQVTVNPVTGATLVLTYIKTSETTPTPTP
jgi:hypothetical protein